MTETKLLKKPVPVRKGRVSEPVRLLGVRVIVSPVSKSAQFGLTAHQDQWS